jgi:hypothetical protein
MTDFEELDVRLLGRRVGDVDRAKCADLLVEAFVDGRLSQAEFDARLDRSAEAVTDVELARLTHDLRPPAARTGSSETFSRRGSIRRHAATAAKVTLLQAALVLAAWAIGVDFESEARSAFTIAFEIWLVGSASAVGGILIGRNRSRAAEGRSRGVSH